MDFKRRKLDNFESAEFLKIVNSGNLNKIFSSIMFLKQKLNSQNEVVSFLDAEKSSFNSLLALFHKLSVEMQQSISPTEHNLLKEIISLMANLCYFSIAACIQIKNFPHVASKLVLMWDEAVKSNEMITTVLRFASNLCKYKETASVIASNTDLLTRIASLIDNDNESIAQKSLRIIQLIAKHGTHLKSLIISRTCCAIAQKILKIGSAIKVKERKDVLQILFSLLQIYPKDVGRQLAGSNCTSIFLEILFEDENLYKNNSNLIVNLRTNANTLTNNLWKTFLLKLTRYSFEIREAFGIQAIQRVLSFSELNDYKCEFLCCFAQDAWCRLVLRENGALTRLLDMLESPTCDPIRQQKIIASLKHFIYDTQSMSYLCQRPEFMRVALAQLRDNLKKTRIECEVKYYPGDERIYNKNKNNFFVDRNYGMLQIFDDDTIDTNKDSSLIQKTQNDTVQNFDENEVALIKEFNDKFIKIEEKTTNEEIDQENLTNLNEINDKNLSLCSKEVFSLGDSQIDLDVLTTNVRFSPKNTTNMFERRYWSPSWSPSMSPSSSSQINASEMFMEDFNPTFERSVMDFLDDSVVSAAVLELSETPAYTTTLPKENGAIANELTDEDLIKNEEESNKSLEVSNKKEFIKKLNTRNLKKKAFEEEFAKCQITDECIDIISKLTHLEENYEYLIKQEVIETLIDYLSDAPIFDKRLVRLIKRLARSKSSLQRLLELKFHQIVIRKLIRRKCILSRFSKFCAKCDQCREFGCDLITEFAGYVDSSFGWNLLQIDLRSDEKNTFQNALLSGLILIRNQERVSRFYHNYVPIDTLLSELASILNNPDVEFDEDSKASQICNNILMAFSSLITQRSLKYCSNLDFEPQITESESDRRCNNYKAYMEKEMEKNQPKKICCLEALNELYIRKKKKLKNKVQIELKKKDLEKNSNKNCVQARYGGEIDGETEFEGEQILKIYNKKNCKEKPILIIPKQKLCESNLYFKGMFDNEFLEKIEGRNKFYFNENVDHCNEKDFIKFLHYVYGCRDSMCVNIDSGECCVALIYLADKYLCSNLLSELLKPNGKAKTLMNGSNLRVFIPLMLTITTIYEALANHWAFVFLRYSNESENLITLNYFRNNPETISSLIEILQTFLTQCTSNPSFYQSLSMNPLWDV